jgi:hypothetical protein
MLHVPLACEMCRNWSRFVAEAIDEAFDSAGSIDGRLFAATWKDGARKVYHAVLFVWPA